jgi:hypothetical protein
MNFDYLNRELHADVQNLKAGKANNDAPPYSDVLSAFKYVKYLFLDVLIIILNIF